MAESVKIAHKVLLALSVLLLLMSVDFTYQWSAPITSEGQLVPWHSSAGLRNGMIGVFNQDFGADGRFDFQVCTPRFFPLPVVASGGPEGGGAGMAVWFFVGIVLAVWYFWARVRRAQPSAPPNGGPATRLGNSDIDEGPPSVSCSLALNKSTS